MYNQKINKILVWLLLTLMNFNSLILNKDFILIYHLEAINTEEDSKILNLKAFNYRKRTDESREFVNLDKNNSTEEHQIKSAINIMPDD